MATLSVLKFNTPEGADTMLGTLQSLQAQQLIQIHDAAIVRWPPGAKKPKTQQLSDITGAGALGGAFWGMLFGVLFFVPCTSALFLLTSGAVVDRIAEAVKGQQFELVTTNLSAEEEAKLRESFSGHIKPPLLKLGSPDLSLPIPGFQTNICPRLT
jgi:uncharacterized membrane protein